MSQSPIRFNLGDAMKFHIEINLERMDAQTDMVAVRDHVIDMVQMADRAGFKIAWAAEHHALEN
jgi:alkanesulfonate monooxygenase SsuD/methylene tetrahydromethanopterin reductase-like flavin-dependent oxidoreductase (luciferase family)